jgi:hypothetical protein
VRGEVWKKEKTTTKKKELSKLLFVVENNKPLFANKINSLSNFCF